MRYQRNRKVSQAITAFPGFARKERPENLEASISQYVHSEANAFIYTEKLQKPNFHLAIQEPLLMGTRKQLEKTQYLIRMYIRQISKECNKYSKNG